MRKIKLVGFIGLIVFLAGLFIAWAEQSKAPKPDIPIPPPVRPLIVLSGSDYDMGYQNYQQIAEVLHPYILKKFQRSFTEKELAVLKNKESLVRKEAPEMIEYMEGMAQGATNAGIPLSYNEVLAGFVGTRTVQDRAGQQYFEPDDCSGWAAWGTATKDGKLIVTGCGDHGLVGNFPDEVTLLVYPKTGNNYVVTTSSGGWHPGMNNKGLGYAHHGGGYCGRHGSDPKKPARTYDGLSPSITTPHTLRFANNANEAKDITISLTTDSRGLWADVKGNNWNVECNETALVRKAGDYGEKDFIYATNNALIPKLTQPEETYIPHLGQWGSRASISSVARNSQMWNMLVNYHGQVDLEFAKMMWRFPSTEPPYPTIEEAEAVYMETLGAGWDHHIANLSNSAPSIGVPDNGNNGLWYVSQGPLVRFSNPQSPGNRHVHINSTYTFYEVKLDETLAKAVAAAGTRAHYDLYYANRELSKLTWSDVAYAPLKELLNKAVEGWIGGEYFTQLAEKSEGNESVLNLGRAMRGYTNAQAYAKQVFEALVQPPAKPEDLGLREYLGPWGKWIIHPHKDKK
jgi:hypothetical protein